MEHISQKVPPIRRAILLSVFICVHLLLITLTSCSSKPTDMRTLVPADALIYLEANNLQAALVPIVESKPFRQAARTRPDFSPLKSVQVAVAVTGFELSEEKLTDENSVGRVLPRFVAVADTHSWNWQARTFAEQKVGGLVQQLLGDDAKMERNPKSEPAGALWLTWTGQNRQQAHVLVVDSLIYFGNDESAIDKCLAVRRGDAESVAAAGKVPTADSDTLASGYVSTDGVAQIAAVAGLKLASEASEDEDVQSAVAGLVPRLLRGVVTDLRWTYRKTEIGIEDTYFISMPAEVANVFSETLTAGEDTPEASAVNNSIVAHLPADTATATCYTFKNIQLAWRSVLLTAQKGLSPIEAAVMAEVSSLLFEPYGIRDPEMFLSSLSGVNGQSANIVTARLSTESDDSVILAAIPNLPTAQKALSQELKPIAPAEGGPAVWSTEDGDIQAVFGAVTRIASKDDQAKLANPLTESPRSEQLKRLAARNAPIVTIGHDYTTALPLIAILAGEGHGDVKVVSRYVTETVFTRTGMERRTVSDFGLIGSLIAAINDAQTGP